MDEVTVVEACKSGHLAAAGLGAFENEPNLSQALLGVQNVCLTAHNAGGTFDTTIAFERLAMVNILAYLEKGRAGLKIPVNLQWLKDCQ